MYKIEDGKIIRIDGTEIPRDITNPAYTQYLHWQRHGVYVGPEETGPDVPDLDIVLEPAKIKAK